MLKLNASYSKKVPAEQEYSSKSFMACVEVELPTGASAQELQTKIAETFQLVKASVEDELAGKTTNVSSQQPERSQGESGGRQEHQSTTSDPRATNKQVQYILSLGKEQRLGLPE